MPFRGHGESPQKAEPPIKAFLEDFCLFPTEHSCQPSVPPCCYPPPPCSLRPQHPALYAGEPPLPLSSELPLALRQDSQHAPAVPSPAASGVQLHSGVPRKTRVRTDRRHQASILRHCWRQLLSDHMATTGKVRTPCCLFSFCPPTEIPWECLSSTLGLQTIFSLTPLSHPNLFGLHKPVLSYSCSTSVSV